MDDEEEEIQIETSDYLWNIVDKMWDEYGIEIAFIAVLHSLANVLVGFPVKQRKESFYRIKETIEYIGEEIYEDSEDLYNKMEEFFSLKYGQQ